MKKFVEQINAIAHPFYEQGPFVDLWNEFEGSNYQLHNRSLCIHRESESS